MFAGILFISAATLLLEIAWTRILSVTLWYHFAFMALSTALFGFGTAGVVLSLRSSAQPVSDRALGRFAYATPFAFVVGYGLSNLIPFEPFSLGRDGAQWIYLLLFYLAATIPFFFSGLTVAALLSRYASNVHRLYLFDLVGAGLGALSVVLLLPWTGGTGTILFAAGTAGIGGLLVARPRRPRAMLLGVFSLTCLVASPFGDALMPVRISRNKLTGDGVPLAEVFADPKFHRYTGWNAISRVDVVEWRDRARRFQRTMFIDGGTAVTRIAHPMGRIASLRPGRDELSFFLGLRQEARVLVLGSGGGREVLLAVRSGAAKVAAVEINPTINFIVKDRMADFTGGLYALPEVAVHTDEARHFIDRTGERYDVILLPHTISNAAMASGSLSLAENYLLTLEAFEAFFSRLSDDGILFITRPEAHLPRLFSTARAALQVSDASSTTTGESGTRFSAEGTSNERTTLASRVIAWRRPVSGQSFYGGVVFKKRPFTAAEVDSFVDTLSHLRLEALYLPGQRTLEPYHSLAAGKPLSTIPLPYPAILTPATDEKPFFNRRVPFSKLTLSDITAVFSRGQKGRIALENRPVTEAALIALLAESAAVALVFILGPLFVFRRRALREGSGRGATVIAFLALGLAYITVEMGLIHRLTLYLGRPALVMATVLGTLLIGSGVGSAFSARFQSRRAPGLAALAAAVAGLAAAQLIALIATHTLALSDPLRVSMTVMVIAPVGFVMGMPFPLLLRRLKETCPARIPWAFGINGLASVIGTVTALLIAMTLGQTAVLLAGVLCYIAAAAAAIRL